MRRNISFFLTSIIFLVLVIQLDYRIVMGDPTPHLRFYPGFVMRDFVGEFFTVACVLENAQDLEGVDVKFSWNTTYLQCMTHTVTAPVEDYPESQPPSPYAGIIHAPLLVLKDTVDEIAGTYHVSMATLGGPTFNGSGTIFLLTFMVAAEPWEVDFVDTYLHFESTGILNSTDPMPHTTEDGVVRISNHLLPHHDVRVTQVSTSKSNGILTPVVGQSYAINISSTIHNDGNFTETFNVTLYANFILFDYTIATLIDNWTIPDLEMWAHVSVNSTWNTTGWAIGYYILNVTADTVPREADPTDNSLTLTVIVSILGDVDGDFDVDLYDAVRLLIRYGFEKGDPEYDDPNCDIDGDDDVDLFDAVTLLTHYGETYP